MFCHNVSITKIITDSLTHNLFTSKLMSSYKELYYAKRCSLINAKVSNATGIHQFTQLRQISLWSQPTVVS
jgi:hypothetical protein